jgi:hypothetical protein
MPQSERGMRSRQDPPRRWPSTATHQSWTSKNRRREERVVEKERRRRGSGCGHKSISKPNRPLIRAPTEEAPSFLSSPHTSLPDRGAARDTVDPERQRTGAVVANVPRGSGAASCCPRLPVPSARARPCCRVEAACEGPLFLAAMGEVENGGRRQRGREI